AGGDSPARPGQIRRLAGRHGEKSGDVVLPGQLDECGAELYARARDSCPADSSAWSLRSSASLSAAKSERETQAEERPQRELRPRIAGTAHAQREWWLLAARRHRGRQGLHRLDHRKALRRRRL